MFAALFLENKGLKSFISTEANTCSEFDPVLQPEDDSGGVSMSQMYITT